MTNENDKLDRIINDLAELKGDLKAHLAVDERMWKQVDENEQDIKRLVEANGKVKAKLAVITASIAGAGASLPQLLRFIIP